MFRPPASVTLDLGRDEVMTFRPNRDTWLQVRSGRVWATRAGELCDHFLQAGDGLDLPRGRLATLSGEPVASCRLEYVGSATPFASAPRAPHRASRGAGAAAMIPGETVSP